MEVLYASLESALEFKASKFESCRNGWNLSQAWKSSQDRPIFLSLLCPFSLSLPEWWFFLSLPFSHFLDRDFFFLCSLLCVWVSPIFLSQKRKKNVTEKAVIKISSGVNCGCCFLSAQCVNAAGGCFSTYLVTRWPLREELTTTACHCVCAGPGLIKRKLRVFLTAFEGTLPIL